MKTFSYQRRASFVRKRTPVMLIFRMTAKIGTLYFLFGHAEERKGVFFVVVILGRSFKLLEIAHRLSWWSVVLWGGALLQRKHTHKCNASSAFPTPSCSLSKYATISDCVTTNSDRSVRMSRDSLPPYATSSETTPVCIFGKIASNDADATLLAVFWFRPTVESFRVESV